MEALPENIRLKLNNTPDQPGVYIMKNSGGEIIYIGKALSLKKRVSSYFQKKESDIKTAMLVRSIHDIEYMVTDSEIEALILESTLIKKHRPKYNINLKDDKRYPYIVVTMEEEYPRVFLTRKLIRNKNKFFGPYTDAKAARNMVSIINSIFKLKTCGKQLPLNRDERPCINFQIKKCGGVCSGIISKEEYEQIIHNAVSFLEGNVEPVLKNMNELMRRYSESREYEKAAGIRDILSDIRKISEKQYVYSTIGADIDYIGILRGKDEAIAVLFEFRSGVLLGRKISIFENTDYSAGPEIIKSFIMEYYQNIKPPPLIISQYGIDDKKILEEHLSGQSSRKVKISLPVSPNDRSVINMIQKNIDVIAADRESYRLTVTRKEGLTLLKEILNLKTIPNAIECFDISNIQGKYAVASMARFSGGLPDKKNYRRYRIRAYDSPDDPGMIHEALGRRLQYLLNEDIKLPDLIVIDGGSTQLSRALEVKTALDADTAVISIAKRFEEIYTEKDPHPLRIKENSPALRILQNIRDEAHRFAIEYHRKLRGKEIKKSEIDDIPDIGEKKKILLLKHFKNVEDIKNSSLSELSKAPGIGKKTAKKIYDFFHAESR